MTVITAIYTHLPAEGGSIKAPCGARARGLSFDAVPTCGNCRRIAVRRFAGKRRVEGAKLASEWQWSTTQVVAMLAVGPPAHGVEIRAAARERGMPIDRGTTAWAAATWLRTVLGQPVKLAPLLEW